MPRESGGIGVVEDVRRQQERWRIAAAAVLTSAPPSGSVCPSGVACA